MALPGPRPASPARRARSAVRAGPGRRLARRGGRGVPAHVHDRAAQHGETRLRVLEASHKAMHSSLHSLADCAGTRPRRLPLRGAPAARRGVRRRAGGDGPVGRDLRAPRLRQLRLARRRSAPPDGGGAGTTTARAPWRCSSHRRPTSTTWCPPWWRSRSSGTSCTPCSAPTPCATAAPAEFAAACGGAEDDWAQLRRGVGGAFADRLDQVRAPPALAADPHARWHPGRLRAGHAALVAAGDRADALRGAARPPRVLREQQLAQPRQPGHRAGPAPPGRAGRRRGARRARRAARGAARLPRGPRRGQLGQPPLLRRAHVAARARSATPSARRCGARSARRVSSRWAAAPPWTSPRR